MCVVVWMEVYSFVRKEKERRFGKEGESRGRKKGKGKRIERRIGSDDP